MSEEEVVSEQLSVNPSSLRYDATGSQRSTPLRQGCEGQAVNSEEDTGKQGLTVAADSDTGRTVVPERAGEDARAPKTQGVRANRGDGRRRVLEKAARAAAKTGKRGDVHEYMRIRRGYV
jgi:hypothetical protein